jgi:hypothetical protein
LILTGVTLAILLPFIGKPLHIDDPVFLWCARQIQSHPFDFYGFKVNWFGRQQLMAAIMEKEGAVPVDEDQLRFFAGDVVVVPTELSNAIELSPRHVRPWFEESAATLPFLATMSIHGGAGFYSSKWGPLPFVFGPAPPARYLVYRVE